MDRNPYLNAADLAGMYASRQWVEGWKAAEGDRIVHSKINAAGREIADEIKRSSMRWRFHSTATIAMGLCEVLRLCDHPVIRSLPLR